MYQIILVIIAILTVMSVTTTKWYLSKGILKPVYHLNIFTSLLHATVNWAMFLHDSEQIGMLIYNFLSVYTIVMAIRGLNRLKEEDTNETKANRN